MTTTSCLDAAIIDHVFQPVINRLQASPKPAALSCLVGAAILALATAIYEVACLPKAGYGPLIDAFVFGCMYRLLDDEPDAPFGARNPLRIDPRYIIARLFGLGLAGLLIATPDVLAPFLLLVAAMFFIACDQPPPSKPVTEPLPGFAMADQR